MSAVGDWRVRALNDTRYLHHVGANKVSQSQHGSELIVRVLEEEKSDRSMGAEVDIKLRNEERRKLRGRKGGVISRLFMQRTGSSRLESIDDEISEDMVSQHCHGEPRIVNHTGCQLGRSESPLLTCFPSSRFDWI